MKKSKERTISALRKGMQPTKSFDLIEEFSRLQKEAIEVIPLRKSPSPPPPKKPKILANSNTAKTSGPNKAGLRGKTVLRRHPRESISKVTSTANGLAKTAALKIATAKNDTSNKDVPKIATVRPDASRLAVAGSNISKSDAANLAVSRIVTAKNDIAKLDASKLVAAKNDASDFDASEFTVAKSDILKQDIARSSIAELDASKNAASQMDVARNDAARFAAAEIAMPENATAKSNVSNLDINHVASTETLKRRGLRMEGTLLSETSGQIANREAHACALQTIEQLREKTTQVPVDSYIFDMLGHSLSNPTDLAMYLYLYRRTIGESKQSVQVSSNLWKHILGISRNTARSGMKRLNQCGLVRTSGEETVAPVHEVLTPWRELE